MRASASTLDGEAPQDRTPPCDIKADPYCAGAPTWNSYSIEVVQRIGYDSFTPASGVLLAKNKVKPDNSCGYGCFTWVIDAHPEDIGKVDFIRPDGTAVMRTPADYRQLNDALFHAGLNSGSEFEWEDAPNRLHFYVIDVHRDSAGVLSYTRWRAVARRQRAAETGRCAVGAACAQGRAGRTRCIHAEEHGRRGPR